MTIHRILGCTLLCISLVSCGGGGGSGGNSDNTAPIGYQALFDIDPIDETNQASVSFSVTGAEVGATYNFTLTSGSASLSGSGAVSQGSFSVTGLDLSGFPQGTVDLDFSLTDDAGNQGVLISDSASKTSLPDGFVTLSGRVTFDFVPREPIPAIQNEEFGLDYDNIETRPVRGATLQILDSSGNVTATTTTDTDGDYSLDLMANQSVQVRVRAEIVETGTASWDFSVTDNTSGNALYVLDGELAALGTADQIRDLHAPSGWGFPGYTEERAAAPFAILDTVYQIVERFIVVDPSIQFPAAEFRWSENNRQEDGDLADGEISTSSYRSVNNANGGGNIYILGDEDADTDEYDRHVIVHEWGHYFEDQLSRSDSIGGSHSIVDHLDFRVAFGEGWGNALSAMILDDEIYIDTFGPAQGQAGGFSVELNEAPIGSSVVLPAGWYSEFSVQSILYDLYDDNNDGVDDLSLGLAPIYEALTTSSYREQGTLTSIFSFLDQLKSDNAPQADGINDLAVAQNIFGTGFDGAGETNDGNASDVLPVYRTVTVGGPAIEVCSDNTRGDTPAGIFEEYNRLGNRSFVRVNLPSSGTYSFEAERVSGNVDVDADLRVWGPFPPLGEQVLGFTCGTASDGDSESMNCGGLLAGDHVIEVFDAGNVDEEDDTGGSVCFDVSVSN